MGSDKQISPGNRRAIAKAARAGKTVILNTGRRMSELEEYLGLIHEVRYLNCASGALVYDLKEKRTLYSSLLSVETVKQLLELAALEQAVPYIFLEQCIIQKSHCEQMERFGMDSTRISLIASR
uniref:HAD hydrolase family protein n=1 Tax=Enterocloster asparagiformis TaxID=333367 RepID=UPI0036F33C85